MPVDVHGEGRSGVSQIFLERFDVHAALDADHRIGMAEIVEPGVGCSDLFHHPLETAVDGLPRQESAPGVGEHHPGLLPIVSHALPVKVLPCLLQLEEPRHTGGHGNHALLPVFGGQQMVFPTGLVLPLELLLDQDGPVRKVHAVPGEPQKLSLPHAGVQRNLEQVFMGMARKEPQKRCNLLRGQRLDLLLVDFRQHAALRGVQTEHSVPHCLLEGLVQNPVDVLDGLRRDRVPSRIAGEIELVVEALDHWPGELVHPDAADERRDVQPDALLVEVCRGGLDAQEILLLPEIHPLVHRQLGGVNVGALVDLHRCLPELLRHLCFGLSGDAPLDLLPCNGVCAHGVACFPIGVALAVVGDGLFSNCAGALCRPGVAAWHECLLSCRAAGTALLYPPRGICARSFHRVFVRIGPLFSIQTGSVHHMCLQEFLDGFHGDQVLLSDPDGLELTGADQLIDLAAAHGQQNHGVFGLVYQRLHAGFCHSTSLSAELPSASCMSNIFCIFCAVCAICTICAISHRAEKYRTNRTSGYRF